MIISINISYVIILILVIIASVVRYMIHDIVQIASDGWVLYYSPKCGHCTTQLNDLGWMVHWLPTVNCDVESCSENISAFPTWLNEVTGQTLVGAIPIDDLRERLVNAS